MKLTLRLFWAIVIMLLGLPMCTTVKVNNPFDDYVKMYSKEAIRQMEQYKIPASIKLAQGLLESGAGRSRLATEGNNHFGMKCNAETTESVSVEIINGSLECFRKYKHVKDSYEDHSLFLTERPRYAELFKLDIRDYKGWAKGLQHSGYATDINYADKLISIIEKYKLYKYDYQ